MRRRLTAEFIATFCLVFAGTGAAIVNELTGTVTHPGVALVFGLIVMSMIGAFGDISGAHMNPAVSVGFWLSGRFPLKSLGPYIAAQSLGALAASGVLLVLFPQSDRLGMTLPAGTVAQSFLLEVLLTLILMLVVLAVAHGPKEKGLLAGLTIGGVVAVEAMFAGPISGASMNPARSLAPAVVTGHFEHLWIYLTATTLGAALAVPLARIILPDGNADRISTPTA